MGTDGTGSAVASTDELRQRLGAVDMRQIRIWRRMTPVQRLDIAFQAYQFALETVRLTEEQRSPDLTPEELAWRVTWRMQGDRKLGRDRHDFCTAD